ncbi:NusG domain II-containing protein [Paenibacillus antri]|uniref:NusG domain II-containing protein n=1 Tax=Paenibacillus antri TaxID=2582848 RepID=A0A5R9FYL0_9BACL|nr:NusG domain II-containing protein [Paenibacillus antri]TLS48571.1 NusG domain II-containing protein [Paenibacillus antri]
MKRGDFWLIGIIVLAAAYFMVAYIRQDHAADRYDGKAYAVVTVDGKPFRTIELTESAERYEIQTEFGYNLLEVKDGGIRMLEADCPDDICIEIGEVRKLGETIVCLPNRVMVEIVGDAEEGGETDAVAT